jgi:hypothetical protein
MTDAVAQKLAKLFADYQERMARAESGGQADQLVRDYARACIAALDGVGGDEAAMRRAHYRAMLEGVGV